MLLSISGLSAHYGRIRALNNVDLNVGKGELVALVGANGAGKTTLMRTISGVQAASSGTISFDGQQMYDRSGPMPEAQARELAASSFGFSAARFALTEGFDLLRVADDQVEGHPCYFIQITDPNGGNTLVAIDTKSHLFRYIGWQTPRGWHHRVYSDYYALESLAQSL